jgi:hypothetical protein
VKSRTAFVSAGQAHSLALVAVALMILLSGVSSSAYTYDRWAHDYDAVELTRFVGHGFLPFHAAWSA